MRLKQGAAPTEAQSDVFEFSDSQGAGREPRRGTLCGCVDQARGQPTNSERAEAPDSSKVDRLPEDELPAPGRMLLIGGGGGPEGLEGSLAEMSNDRRTSNSLMDGVVLSVGGGGRRWWRPRASRIGVVAEVEDSESRGYATGQGRHCD